MAEETLKELKYNGSKVIAEVARRDDEGNKIPSTYLTDVQLISEDEIDTAFESVFGKNTTTTLKKLLDATKSAYSLFSNYEGTSVNDVIKYDDTSNVTDMSYMFSGCSKLTTIPLLDTSNVISMREIFANCSSLTTIPLLNTSNVTDMRGMFYNCYSLTIVPAFNTSNVTGLGGIFGPGMTNMFQNCINIEEIHMINISTNLDISYCTKMTREALLEVLGNLKDLTDQTSKTLTLGSTLLAKLTEEDKLIATNKNWTLA